MDTGTMETTGSLTSESTENNSTDTSGQGQVDTQGSQGQQGNAGDSQGNADGGREQGTEPRRQFKSKNQTIYELRQAIRERDRQYQELNERLSQFEQRLQPRQERKPSRTFWEAPEEVLDERITGHLTEMEKRILEKMEARDSQLERAHQWNQEKLEAAELIQKQLKLTPEEEIEFVELLKSDPLFDQLSPMQRANYGMYLWNQSKGIRDNGLNKRRAATIVTGGQPTSGPKMWTEQEMNAELAKFPQNPASWTQKDNERYQELEREFKKAYAEKRVRK